MYFCLQELGLDELRNAATMRPTPRPIQPDPASSTPSTSSSSDEPAAAGSEVSSSNPPMLRAVTEDIAKQLDPDIELKRAMSEQAAWGGQTPVAVAAAPAAAAAEGEGKAAAEGSQGAGKVRLTSARASNGRMCMPRWAVQQDCDIQPSTGRQLPVLKLAYSC